MSPSEAILRTVAESPLSDPVDRAECELALLVGDFDPHATLESLLAEVDRPRPDDAAPLVGRLARIAAMIEAGRRA